MKFLLRFECIGDGAPQSRILHQLGFKGLERYHVYALGMIGGRLERRYTRHMKDYTHSNSAGTRGVYAEYILSDSEFYEVKQPKSWTKADLYYCTVRDGELVRLTRDEVMACLANAPLGLPSTKRRGNG